MYIFLMLAVIAMLGVLTLVLDNETNNLQENITNELTKSNKRLTTTQLELKEQLEEMKSNINNRDKLIEILIRQLSEARAKNNDLENNLEFVLNNLENEKSKELVQDSNKTSS